MGAFLLVVGLIWAVIGGFNIIGQDWMDPEGKGILVMALIFNMVLFVIPGLLLAGLGSYMYRRQSGATAAAPPEARIKHLGQLLENGIITQAEYDARRAEILKTV